MGYCEALGWGGGKRTQGGPLAFTQLLHENTSHLLR